MLANCRSTSPCAVSLRAPRPSVLGSVLALLVPIFNTAIYIAVASDTLVLFDSHAETVKPALHRSNP